MSSYIFAIFSSSKASIFSLNFRPKIPLKLQHIVIQLYFLLSKPLFVIRTTASQYLELLKRIPIEPGGALTAGYIYEVALLLQ